MSFLDKTASLTPKAQRIICEKATEYPHSGIYNEVRTEGTYLCRRCGLPLFKAKSQFTSGCGWPGFDDDISNAVHKKPDPDGIRTEIVCKRCDGHLGHIFTGEYLTPKNRRYCVNAAAIDFVENSHFEDTEEAILAGGCFWGVAYLLQQLPGVLKTEVGYTGGIVEAPSYQQVCQDNTEHYEAVRVLYDVDKIDYEAVVKRFFEIHDPTDTHGQGPDRGQQYQSAVFYYNQEQKAIAKMLIQQLQNKGYEVATKLLPVQTFWSAEDYHQDYYVKQGKEPYCHHMVKRFS